MPLAVAELPGHATQDLFAGGEIKEPIKFPFRFDLIDPALKECYAAA
jgi:hypothetical protein